MSTPPGISRLGRDAERRFCDLTGAELCATPALGDALLDGHYVEVKKADGNTINQVRAVKYITLVVYRPELDSWFVVPADEIVRLVARKTRGQHSENPFESATLSIRDLADFRVQSASDLRAETLAAATRSEARQDLRDAMVWVLAECRGLADEALERVGKLF